MLVDHHTLWPPSVRNRSLDILTSWKSIFRKLGKKVLLNDVDLGIRESCLKFRLRHNQRVAPRIGVEQIVKFLSNGGEMLLDCVGRIGEDHDMTGRSPRARKGDECSEIM